MFTLRQSQHATPPALVKKPFPYPLDLFPSMAVVWPNAPKVSAPDLSGVQTIAAPMVTIRAIEALWQPKYPIVVLSDVWSGLMSDADRDHVWERFGMPVFEYLVNGRQILARECEAHEGLHFALLSTSLAVITTADPCPCGKPGPRLLELNYNRKGRARADVAKLADAPDLGSGGGNSV